MFTLTNRQRRPMTMLTHLALCGAAGLLLTSTALAADAAVDDADISYWVRDALRIDPRVAATSISVSTKDGIVTLSGAVGDLASRTYADLEARKIRGVRGVVNQIEITPPFRYDSVIAQEARRRLLNSAAVQSQDIRVTAVKGHVTLTGRVPTWSEKDEAESLASEVYGVKVVQNELAITYAKSRSDREIQADIVASLRRDVYLSRLPITVAVKDGIVTLGGEVGSAYEKVRAENDALQISHVKDVKSQLQVNWLENRRARDDYRVETDEQLKRALTEEFAADDRLNAASISLLVHQGQVTLDGTVSDYSQKQVAEEDARDVVGVGWVTNQLVVKTDRRSNWSIVDDVNHELKSDYKLHSDEINVRGRDGTVTLTGDVHNWWERAHAKDVATRVLGVKHVINETHVHWASEFSDAALTKQIRSRIFWNAVIGADAKLIVVQVKNGVVTLDGDVESWAHRREAAKVAYKTPGIWLVDNRVKVNGYEYDWEEWFYNGNYQYKPPAEYDTAFED